MIIKLQMLVRGYNKNKKWFFLAEFYTNNKNDQFFTENHIVKYVDSNKVKNNVSPRLKQKWLFWCTSNGDKIKVL